MTGTINQMREPVTPSIDETFAPDGRPLRAWGHATTPLTLDEWAQLERLGCAICVESFADAASGPAVWEVCRAGDGSYLGPPSQPHVRGYLRWLIAYQIVPEAPEGKPVACVGKAGDHAGGWIGWSHRAARRCSTRADAVEFAEGVS